MRPRRIQRHRYKGWRMPEGAVYVGRPTRWGNPWAVGQDVYVTLSGIQRGFRVGEFDPSQPFTFELGHQARLSAADAVRLYREDLLAILDDDDDDAHNDELRRALRDLAGHDLVCWCELRRPCHADVLLDLANR